jgi:RES domain-containing protein
VLVWRLSSGRHDPLSGEGARRVGGRWNSPGRAAVYASESLALALVEALVHIPGAIPRDYIAFRIRLPDAGIERLEAAALPVGWHSNLGLTRAIGDQWLAQRRSLALFVPSAVLPESWNVLLNPDHPDRSALEVTREGPLRFDPRLRPGSTRD